MSLAAVVAGCVSPAPRFCEQFSLCPATEPLTATVGQAVQIVPSDLLPADANVQVSHNNLDAIAYQGAIFLAYRSAPSHFASTETKLTVLRTTDLRSFTTEATFQFQRDLREPSFLVIGNQLHLYFATLGTDPSRFEPGTPRHSIRQPNGTWSDAVEFAFNGIVPWRITTLRGVHYMTGHVGYSAELDPQTGFPPQTMHVLRTRDGTNFEPAWGTDSAILRSGASESDFAFDRTGALLAVVRNERGDAEFGWGSKICRAEAQDYGNWRCRADPRKYDSPVVIEHGGDVYFIARRNTTADGAYDLQQRNLSPASQTDEYLTQYWSQPKRCSLWRIDGTSLEAKFILDLPSSGDTCFPRAVQISAHRYVVFNYSSSLATPNISWLTGQNAPTHIHYVTLDFPASGPAAEAAWPAAQITDTSSGAAIRCGERTCQSGNVLLGATRFPIEPCCADNNECGISSTTRPVAAFDLTVGSLLRLQTACMPRDAPGTNCAGGACACPDHFLTVPNPLTPATTYRVPLRGCCRTSGTDAGSCGYRVAVDESNPMLPITLDFSTGCQPRASFQSDALGPLATSVACGQ